jgi:hypothetical protein
MMIPICCVGIAIFDGVAAAWLPCQPSTVGRSVYNDIDEITGDNLTFSYGAGVRLIGSRDFVARVEYGRSEEQAVWRLRFDQIFQFSRGGLFNGRVPVPDR